MSGSCGEAGDESGGSARRGRHSPPTARVVAVLELLADHAQEALTLSAIARGTATTAATCLGILNELQRAHYVIRRADKTYTLGPGALGLGQAAATASPLGEAIRPYLLRLSREQGSVATFSTVLDGDIVVLQSTKDGSISQAGVPRAGQRYPFVPPSGVIFVAWNDDAEVERWLGRRSFVGSDVRPGQIWRVIDFCRRNGYVVERGTDEVIRAYELLERLSAHVPEDLVDRFEILTARIFETRYLLEPIVPTRRYALNMIAAPVRLDGSAAVGIVALYLRRPEVAGDHLAACREALLQTTRQISRELGTHRAVRPVAGDRA